MNTKNPLPPELEAIGGTPEQDMLMENIMNLAKVQKKMNDQGSVDLAVDNEDDATGRFVGDKYYSKEKPVNDNVEYYDRITYDFFNDLYSNFDQDSDQTLKAQRILKDIGYYDGEVDGFYGNKTKGAVKRYLMEKNDIDTVWNNMADPVDRLETEMG